MTETGVTVFERHHDTELNICLLQASCNELQHHPIFIEQLGQVKNKRNS